MDMSLVQAGIASVKALQGIAKVGLDAKVDAKASAKILESTGQLGKALDALYEMRDELFRLQTENNELKRDADRRLAFEARRETYEMVKTAGGAVVWRFKAEPMHYACPNCMNEDRIEVLQDNRALAGTYRCTAKGCTASFPVEPESRPAVLPLPRNRNPYV